MKDENRLCLSFFIILLMTIIVICIDYTEASAETWCLAGDFNGWNNASHPLFDDGTHGDQTAGDGIYSRQYTIPSAGRHEWKIVEQGNWPNNFPASGNSWLNTTLPDQDVLFTFDTNDYSGVSGIVFHPTQNIVHCFDSPISFTAAGDFQGWDNSNPATQLSNAGGGIYKLIYQIPSAGSYMAKIVSTNSWDGFGLDGRSVNSPNIAFSTSVSNEEVTFILNYNTGRVFIGNPPTPSIPTLSEWGMITFALLITGVAIVILRKGRNVAA